MRCPRARGSTAHRRQPRLDDDGLPAATSLRGYGLFTRVGKDNGTLLWEAMANVRSPGFEVNDLAFLDRSAVEGNTDRGSLMAGQSVGLADKVKPLLESRELEMGHARALLGIPDAMQQLDAARQVVRKGLSVRETERLVKRMLDNAGGKKPAKPTESGNADIRRLEIEVTEKIGAKVRLQHSKKGSGKVVISYNNLDELDGILKHIK